MLIKSSPTSSFEAAISFVSDCDWITRDETRNTFLKSDELSRNNREKSILTREAKDDVDDCSSLVCSSACCKSSSVSNMCARSAPNFVYKRRKLQAHSIGLSSVQETISIKGGGCCLPNMSLKDDSFGQIKDKTDSAGASIVFSGICNGNHNCNGSTSTFGQLRRHNVEGVACTNIGSVEDVSKLDSLDKCSCGEEQQLDEAPGSKPDGSGQRKSKIDKAGASVVSTGTCDGDLICNGNTSTFGQIRHHSLEGVTCTNIGSVQVVSKSDSLGGYSGGEGQQYDETSDNKSLLKRCKGNGGVSSSSDVELGSACKESDMDDTGECSSSDVLLQKKLSTKELCISILKSHGLLERGLASRTPVSLDGLGTNDDSNDTQLCKICGHTENPLNMLICDKCEDAFHLSCCIPKIKKIPIHEWYCHPCSKKKHKSVESGTKNSSKIRCEGSECSNRASKSGLSLIEHMLKDSKPFRTETRIGKEFQADVPDWSGPISEEYASFGEPLVMEPTECGSLDDLSTRMANRLSKLTVGNWLQCREILDDNTICGKWRRAPLFEVQTDDWDCSCSVLWDPIHSDCAVPQELDTDQVLMHLKYIQLLRPRLSGNKRKATPSKSDTEDITPGASEEDGNSLESDE